MAARRFVGIGECMIELSGGEGGLYRLGYAGDTLNTSWYMRALMGGDWQVDYLTALGDDRYSAGLRGFLEAHGIGTGLIGTVPGRRPGLYIIHQEAGDRQFTYWRDTSAARLMAEDKAALIEGLTGADLIYFSGISLAILAPRARGRLLGAIVAARDAGARVAFDPNLRPALWSSARVMGSVITAAASISDIVLPTHSDEAPLFGDASPEATADRYLSLGVAEVAVKDGSKPALAATAEERATLAPPSGAEVTDATGAGDSFNGGYLAARLRGLGLAEALAEAHRVAGIVIGQQGALVAPELVRG